MVKVGSIISLFYFTKNGCTSTNELELDVKGILLDKHYDTNIERSVLIASEDSYRLVKNHDIEIPYGTLGENILMDYNPYYLKTGDKLKIGDVTLEISQHCTLCKSFTKIDRKLPKLLKNDRGIFAKVTVGGNIKIGDEIFLLD